jgi:radical SAM-linked protein
VLLFRYRALFTKEGALRWIGHLDLQRCWQRIFRRARLPLALTAGYRPRPRLLFAAALPLGFTSSAELLDFWLTGPQPLDALAEKLRASCPPDMQVVELSAIDLKAPKLTSLVRATEYRIALDETQRAVVAAALPRLVAAEQLMRERRGRRYDLRPLIEQIALDHDASTLTMRLAARPGANGRPDEVLAELGLDPADLLCHRTRLVSL